MRVASLHRWPVKSMAGEVLEVLPVDWRGAPGDRATAVVDLERGRVLTAREAPRLLAWAARLDADGRTHVTAPDGTTRAAGDPALVGALAAELGGRVALHHDPNGQQDLGRTLLVTFEASLQALPAWRDLRRFRTNVHVEGEHEPFAEEGWEGRRLRVGDVELELLHPCERCAIPTRDPDTQAKDPSLARYLQRERDLLFGINARVLGAGELRAGDPVSLG